jgi:hypothetical protein
MATNAPWYVPNHVIHTDLQIPTVREEITRISTNYKAKIELHPNKLTTNLFEKNGQDRLRRYSPLLICRLDSTKLKVSDTEGIHWNTSHHDIVSDTCTELSTNVLKI